MNKVAHVDEWWCCWVVCEDEKKTFCNTHTPSWQSAREGFLVERGLSRKCIVVDFICLSLPLRSQDLQLHLVCHKIY